MDCDCIAQRDGQQAHGQRDAKLHSHGHHAHLLGNPVLDCHRQSAASTRKHRGLPVDDALGTGGICDRRLLPLSVLHHHWVEVWAAVHDSGTHHSRHHGVGHAGTVDQAHGHHSHARHPHWHRHHCAGTRRQLASSLTQAATQWRAVCHWRRSVPGSGTGAEQDRYEPL